MQGPAETYVSVGRILKPHGVRGEVKVDPMTDNPARFKRLTRVSLLMPTGDRQAMHVEAARTAGPSTVLLKLQEVSTPEAANLLRNALIQVPRSESPPLPAGKVYFADMIGLTARIHPSGEEVGEVTAIVQAGNDLLEIRLPDGREILVPWVDDFVREVAVASRTVWLTPVPGLLEP